MSHLPGPTVRHAYGRHPEQFGELTLPRAAAGRSPVAALLHGGFWRAHHTLDLMRPLVAPLVRGGYAVWNVEYRRMGQSDGGWADTMRDVAAGVDHLLDVEERADLDLDRVLLVGHSAGGQLALWAASHRPLVTPPRLRVVARRLRPVAVVSLAGICDLVAAAAGGLGRRAVEHFLGGGPDDVPAHYACASPVDLAPLGVRQVLVHGNADGKVPSTQSRTYVERARAVGDDVTHVELADADHMAVIEPDIVLTAAREAFAGTWR